MEFVQVQPLDRRRLQANLALMAGDFVAIFAAFCLSGFLYLATPGLARAALLAQFLLPLFLTPVASLPDKPQSPRHQDFVRRSRQLRATYQDTKIISPTSVTELPPFFTVIKSDKPTVCLRPHMLSPQASAKPFWQVGQRYAERHVLNLGLLDLRNTGILRSDRRRIRFVGPARSRP